MISAVIFDLDGTLVETEELKALSYARAAVELRPDLDEKAVVEAFKDFVGLSRQEVAVGLMQRFALEEAARARMKEFGVDRPWQAYVRIRLRIYEELLDDPNIVFAHRYPHNIALLCDIVVASPAEGSKYGVDNWWTDRLAVMRIATEYIKFGYYFATGQI